MAPAKVRRGFSSRPIAFHPDMIDQGGESLVSPKASRVRLEEGMGLHSRGLPGLKSGPFTSPQ